MTAIDVYTVSLQANNCTVYMFRAMISCEINVSLPRYLGFETVKISIAS